MTSHSLPEYNEHGVGPTDTRSPFVPYMERTRDWYRALGYDTAYRWARFDEVPFTSLSKPLWSVELIQVIDPVEKTAPPLGVSKKTASARPIDSPFAGQYLIEIG